MSISAAMSLPPAPPRSGDTDVLEKPKAGAKEAGQAGAPNPSSAAGAARLYRGTSIAQRRLERRDQLIEAAVGVYGESGYRSATVKAVCRAAGLTERYFYESFQNSEQLLAAAFEAVMVHLLERLNAAADAAPDQAPLPRARAVLTAYYTTLKENPPGARVFLVEMFGISREIDALLDKALTDIAAVLLPAVAAAASSAGANPAAHPAPGAPAPDLLAVGLVGGVIHIALTWIAGGYAVEVETVVESALPLVRAVVG